MVKAKGLEPQSPPPAALTYAGPTETGDVEVHGEQATVDDEFAGVGRNDLCPCGSGKKYKRCHGAAGGPTGSTARIS